MPERAQALLIISVSVRCPCMMAAHLSIQTPLNGQSVSAHLMDSCEWARGAILSPFSVSCSELAQAVLGQSQGRCEWARGAILMCVAWFVCITPDSKVHGANMGPIWDRQDPGGRGPHVDPMNLAIWDVNVFNASLINVTKFDIEWTRGFEINLSIDIYIFQFGLHFTRKFWMLRHITIKAKLKANTYLSLNIIICIVADCRSEWKDMSESLFAISFVELIIYWLSALLCTVLWITLFRFYPCMFILFRVIIYSLVHEKFGSKP